MAVGGVSEELYITRWFLKGCCLSFPIVHAMWRSLGTGADVLDDGTVLILGPFPDFVHWTVSSERLVFHSSQYTDFR